MATIDGSHDKVEKAAHVVGPARVTVVVFGGVDFTFRNTAGEGSFIVHTGADGAVQTVAPWSDENERYWSLSDQSLAEGQNLWHVTSTGVTLL